MSCYVLLAETGSDIPREIARKLGIYLVPMHVALDDVTLDDGSFPVQRVVDSFNRTGRVPSTSGCTPEDFTRVYNRIHREHPGCIILHLAYSAVTTCSYQSALTAARGRSDVMVISMDTRQVSAGQAAIVLAVAKLLREHPEISPVALHQEVGKLIERARMAFIPNDLTYLRAGGRLSNAAFVCGQLLHIHPCVELQEGRLVATRRYRGSMLKLIPKLMRDITEQHNLSRERLYLLVTPGLSREAQQLAEQTAQELGYRRTIWLATGCVITAHGGPGAFGMAGLTAL